MFRIQNTREKNFEANEPWMVIQYNWLAVAVKKSGYKEYDLLQSEQLSIKVFKPSLRIEVGDRNGKLILAEPISGGSPFGRRTFFWLW